MDLLERRMLVTPKNNITPKSLANKFDFKNQFHLFHITLYSNILSPILNPSNTQEASGIHESK